MKSGSAARRRQSGTVSTILIGLGGFAAGAVLMGLVALTRPPGPVAAVSPRLPASNLAPSDVAPTPTISYGSRAWSTQAERSPWPLESASGPAHAPGPKRPDRLSAPDGWTPEIAPGP